MSRRTRPETLRDPVEYNVRMKRLLLSACFAALCLGQTSSPTAPSVARGWWDVDAAELTSEGHIYHLRGHAEIRGTDIVLRADQIDYDEDKAVIHLAGHVTIETKNKGTLRADDANYGVNSGEVTLKLRLVPAP